jgi:hypothetical protein
MMPLFSIASTALPTIIRYHLADLYAVGHHGPDIAGHVEKARNRRVVDREHRRIDDYLPRCRIRR